MAADAPLPLGNLFTPEQETLENVPVLPLDIFGGVDHFKESQGILKERQEALSPFSIVVGDRIIATTPLPNPRTGLSSHHILRLLNSLQSPLSQRYIGDLFVRDSDLYVVAFRRGIIAVGQVDIVWGRFFCFGDLIYEVPAFLNAIRINTQSAYGGDVTPGGGVLPMCHMFFAFAHFETRRREDAQFQWAVNCAIATFIEPRRVRCMTIEMERRVEESTHFEKLPSFHWKMVHAWASLSSLVQEDRVKRCLSSTNLLPYWCHSIFRLSFFYSLIGADGELLLLKLDKKFLGRTDEELEQLAEAVRGGHVEIPNPMFVIPNDRAEAMAALMGGLI